MDAKEILKASVHELQDRVEGVRRVLNQSAIASDLPLRDGQQLFAEYLRELLALLTERLAEIEQRISAVVSQAALNALSRKTYSSSVVLDVISWSINWLGVTPNHLVSSGLNRHLRKLAATHMPHPQVVLHTVPAINYECIMTERVLAHASDFMRKEDPTLADRLVNFCLLGVPESESENILLHSLLLHELGHKIDSHVALADTISRASQAALQAHAPSDSAKLALYNRMLRSWVAELVSDGLATAWLGPSFVAAQLSLSRGPAIDLLSVTHPTDRVRFQLGKAMMTKAGSLAFFQAYLGTHNEHLDFLLSSAESKQYPPDADQDTCDRSHQCLIDILPDVIDKVVGVSKGQCLEWNEENRRAVDFALVLLHHMIVPLRVGWAPTDRFLEPAEILLAGWAHLTQRDLAGQISDAKNASSAPLEQAEQVHRLRLGHYRRIEKALQDRELLESWSVASGTTINT